RLKLLQAGSNPLLAEERVSVVSGVESAHSRKVVPLGSHTGAVEVRMDAIGPALSLSVDGHAVDSFTDARLNAGALGFYDDTGELPGVTALRFTSLQTTATR